MINPILKTLSMTQGHNNLNQIKSMVNMLKSANDPQAMLNNLINQNPQFKGVMEYINQNGGDPKKAFYDLAEKNGIDPQEILNMLK